MTSIILACLLGAALSGTVGYLVSRKFNGSNYSATNKSGDFGTPRGSFFALMAGVLVGMMFFAYLGKFIFVEDAIGPGMITSMIVGAAGGILGMFHGQRDRKPKD